LICPFPDFILILLFSGYEPNSAQAALAERNEERAKRRARRDEEREQKYAQYVPDEADDGDDKRQLPPLPEDDSSSSDEVVDADDQKQRKHKARFAKVLSTSMSNSLRLNSKSLSRSSLPKLDYASQIKVSEKTFPQWVDQLKVIAFSRNWPEEFITIGGGEWNGKLESDSEKVAIRKECYQWMESSVPQTIKYMITLVRKGDAKGLFTTLWNRFYKVTPLTVGAAEVGAFWNLSQKNMAV